MTALLTAEGLELAYGHVPACRDITINVDEGEIVTLIGANGAGKIDDAARHRRRATPTRRRYPIRGAQYYAPALLRT